MNFNCAEKGYACLEPCEKIKPGKCDNSLGISQRLFHLRFFTAFGVLNLLAASAIARINHKMYVLLYLKLHMTK